MSGGVTATWPGPGANAEQAEAWNSVDGRHWVTHRDRYEAMLRGFTPHLHDAAGVCAGEWVLDIGCGSGETTYAAAVAAGSGSVLGVDLSGPMLDDARRRAAEDRLDNVEFVQADAQAHPFGPASFDVAMSRFGVMFFAHPEVAFANIRRALRAGGRLAFLCWQEPVANEWILALGAALGAPVHLPQMDGEGPGPFSLTDPHRIRELLRDAGFTQVAVDPVTEPMRLAAMWTTWSRSFAT